MIRIFAMSLSLPLVLALSLGFFTTDRVIAAELSSVKVALIEYSEDSRYSDRVIESRYQAQPWGRLYDAAKIALKESKFSAQAAGINLELSRHSVDSLSQLPELLGDLDAKGTQLFMLDLPDAGVSMAATAMKASDSLLFNLSALDNSLREQQCQDNLFHIAPSRAMLTDAMAQYLVFKKWKKVLLLYGSTLDDRNYLASMRKSGKKFGLKFVAEKEYLLGSDPRERYQNNIALMTSKDDYDVVLIVDHQGEFAVDVPYAISKPRPVVGAAGLVPDWWHWNWDRNGAPQVNKRFYKKAKRHMTGYDWSAWLSVKIFTEALLRTGKQDSESLAAYLISDQLKMDGGKGFPLNFRAWNNQLRQPVFMTSLNRVIARAPLEGFLHPTNNLDILGKDKRETTCQLKTRRAK
ncbi:MAG: amino acid ABC transporter substrate-binding protein [Motiliproteus sp.]